MYFIEAVPRKGHPHSTLALGSFVHLCPQLHRDRENSTDLKVSLGRPRLKTPGLCHWAVWGSGQLTEPQLRVPGISQPADFRQAITVSLVSLEIDNAQLLS